MGILEIVFNSRKFDLNDDVLMGFDNYFDKKSKDYNSFCLDEEDINPLQNFVAQIKSADSDSVIYVSTYGYEITNSNSECFSYNKSARRYSGMEHDIGCKIKAARIEKKLTQEQVAELLGVSRQTISNWENEKSYPDIISVIKMSECYDVSLDYLLKGEQKMKSYYDYLEESTNVVKSNANRNKIITILSYLLIWAFAMIVFWFFTSGSDAMGYSLMFLWFILPISTFIVSIVIGKNNFWGKGKWAFTLFFGVMYMLAEYGTFKMANNIAFNKLNAPDLGMIVAGAIISAIGMLVGSLWNKKRHNQKK